MQMGVKFPAAILGEAGNQDPARRFMNNLALIAAAQLRLLFQIGDSRGHRALMGGKHAFVTGNQPHDRHGLGRVDREVPTGVMLDLAIRAVPPELLIADFSST